MPNGLPTHGGTRPETRSSRSQAYGIHTFAWKMKERLNIAYAYMISYPASQFPGIIRRTYTHLSIIYYCFFTPYSRWAAYIHIWQHPCRRSRGTVHT
jgi:hypothetical protein